jgi:hypothetical protein
MISTKKKTRVNVTITENFEVQRLFKILVLWPWGQSLALLGNSAVTEVSKGDAYLSGHCRNSGKLSGQGITKRYSWVILRNYMRSRRPRLLEKEVVWGLWGRCVLKYWAVTSNNNLSIYIYIYIYKYKI